MNAEGTVQATRRRAATATHCAPPLCRAILPSPPRLHSLADLSLSAPSPTTSSLVDLSITKMCHHSLTFQSFQQPLCESRHSLHLSNCQLSLYSQSLPHAISDPLHLCFTSFSFYFISSFLGQVHMPHLISNNKVLQRKSACRSHKYSVLFLPM